MNWLMIHFVIKTTIVLLGNQTSKNDSCPCVSISIVTYILGEYYSNDPEYTIYR